MGRVSPAARAWMRKFWVISARLGRPKEMFDTPSTVWSPNSSRTERMAFSVSIPCSCWAETVRVRQSIHTSSAGMPRSSAAARMRLAMSTRPWAVWGMPPLSRVSPTTDAPYFFTMGRIRASTAGSPFTELTAALPLYTRSPASSASGLEESSWRGRETADCSFLTTLGSMETSSTPGKPTFTSRMSAPASSCWTATSRI